MYTHTRIYIHTYVRTQAHTSVYFLCVLHQARLLCSLTDYWSLNSALNHTRGEIHRLSTLLWWRVCTTRGGNTDVYTHRGIRSLESRNNHLVHLYIFFSKVAWTRIKIRCWGDASAVDGCCIWYELLFYDSQSSPLLIQRLLLWCCVGFRRCSVWNLFFFPHHPAAPVARLRILFFFSFHCMNSRRGAWSQCSINYSCHADARRHCCVTAHTKASWELIARKRRKHIWDSTLHLHAFLFVLSLIKEKWKK